MDSPRPAEMDRIRLLLLADQALFRASVARLLALEPGFDVVAECGAPDDALRFLSEASADVVVIEFEHANDFISAAIRAGCAGRFFVIAAALDARNSAVALRLGAAGVFLKSDSAEHLVSAIRTVAHGGMWIDPGIIRLLADRYPVLDPPIDTSGLTERERKVLIGIAQGLSNRKIGDDLGLSEGSVKAVVQHLFEKAGVRTRSQLVRIAIESSVCRETVSANGLGG